MKLFLCASLLAFANAAFGQFAITWHKIAGGGGASSNGIFSVCGSIGQNDATGNGALTVGGYSLTGGFWALQAVQTAVAPLLTITLTGTNTAIVAWLAPANAFTLQENTNLATANWVNSSLPVTTVNGLNQVTVLPFGGNKFFRLTHP